MEKERQQLEQQVIRGRRVKTFFESNFFKTDFEPWCKEEMGNIAHGRIWKPNAATADQVAMATCFNSGRYVQLEEMLLIFESWVEKGETAAKKLEALEARHA